MTPEDTTWPLNKSLTWLFLASRFFFSLFHDDPCDPKPPLTLEILYKNMVWIKDTYHLPLVTLYPPPLPSLFDPKLPEDSRVDIRVGTFAIKKIQLISQNLVLPDRREIPSRHLFFFPLEWRGDTVRGVRRASVKCQPFRIRMTRRDIQRLQVREGHPSL